MSKNFTIRKHPEGWMARRIVDPIILGPVSLVHLEALMRLSDASAHLRIKDREQKLWDECKPWRYLAAGETIAPGDQFLRGPIWVEAESFYGEWVTFEAATRGEFRRAV